MKKTILVSIAALMLFYSASFSQMDSDSGFQVSKDDMMLVMALLQSPLFKDSFVQSCTVESMNWLGANQADKSCNCAYDRLVKNDVLLQKLMMSPDSSLSGFGQWGYGLVEPCLPKKFTAEMDNAFVLECMKNGELNKAACDCMLNDIKKKYTIRSLMKTALENQSALETDLTKMSLKCLAK